MGEEKSISNQLEEISKLLKEASVDKKEKKFKLPYKGRVSPNKASKGFVTIMKINENGFVDFSKEKIEEQTTMVDGVPRLATPEYVLHWKKNPIIIQPSWSVKPFSPEEKYKESMNDGSNTKGYKLLMNKMKTETVKKGFEMSGWVKWALGLGLAAIIAYAFLTGGGG